MRGRGWGWVSRSALLWGGGGGGEVLGVSRSALLWGGGGVRCWGSVG